MIEISEEAVDRVYAVLNGMRNGHGPTIALQNAINRAMITARSVAAKTVSESYHIKQKDVKGYTKSKIFKANQSTIEAGFMYAGNVVPLIKFQVRPTKPVSGRQRRYTKVSVMKENGATTLVHAYLADLGMYGLNVFERETTKRESSKTMYGPSVPSMMGGDDVEERVSAAAKATFDTRIEHEITRILNGYGG